MITVLLIICAIVFILALLYFTDTAYTKHDCKKYQEPIDDLVEELSLPSSIQTPVITAVQTPAVNTYMPTPNESHDPQYQEAKRKMVANIRTYFNQRKIDASIRETEIKTGLPMNSPMFSSSPDTRSFPTHPSLQRIL